MFLLDLHETSLADALRHLNTYRLRSDVQLKQEPSLEVQLSEEPSDKEGFFKDPRHEFMGYRRYVIPFESSEHASPRSLAPPIGEAQYFLRRFVTGIPESGHDGNFSDLIPFLLNLDILNASNNFPNSSNLFIKFYSFNFSSRGFG